MPDWKKSMQQTFEYYTVNPYTWADNKSINIVTSSSIKRSRDLETLGNASLEVTDSIGECYVRIYLVTNQNGVKERFPLATVLAQTPGESFNGKHKTISIDAYTPLIELKEDSPPLGYTIMAKENIMKTAGNLISEHMRGPVVKNESCNSLVINDYTANSDDTWLSYLTDLVGCANYQLEVDEMGRTLFSPIQEMAALQPVTTFDDDNSSILLPDVTIDKDLYGIPNVVEVLYSQNSLHYFVKVENNDVNSPVSIKNRGRVILYRDTSPNVTGVPSKAMIEEYARNLLESLSTLKYQITFSHGYYPVRVGDCVRLNYTRAGLNNVKALITEQTIKCTTGCKIEETAIYTKKLWEG